LAAGVGGGGKAVALSPVSTAPETKVFLLLFLQKKKTRRGAAKRILLFLKKKKQKNF
jgi:hypothetical protein